MAIIRWRPFDLESWLQDIDMPTVPGLNRLGQGLNIYETKESIVAEAALPGVPEENIDVTVDGGVVRVSGTARQQEEDKDKRRYYMSSMSSSYNYAFRLPEGLKSDEPKCELEDGVLMMTFSKEEQKPPKKVAVKRREKESKDKGK